MTKQLHGTTRYNVSKGRGWGACIDRATPTLSDMNVSICRPLPSFDIEALKKIFSVVTISLCRSYMRQMHEPNSAENTFLDLVTLTLERLHACMSKDNIPLVLSKTTNALAEAITNCLHVHLPGIFQSPHQAPLSPPNTKGIQLLNWHSEDLSASAFLQVGLGSAVAVSVHRMFPLETQIG